MIRFQCQSCGQTIKARDELAGKSGKCKCGELVRIPTPNPFEQANQERRSPSEGTVRAEAEPVRPQPPSLQPKGEDPGSQPEQVNPAPIAKRRIKMIIGLGIAGSFLAVLLALGILFIVGPLEWLGSTTKPSADPETEQARLGFDNALAAWKERRAGYNGCLIVPSRFLFANLLDYKITSFAAEPHGLGFMATAVLQIETQGSLGAWGGGPVEPYQIKYKISRNTAGGSFGPWYFNNEEINRYAPLP